MKKALCVLMTFALLFTTTAGLQSCAANVDNEVISEITIEGYTFYVLIKDENGITSASLIGDVEKELLPLAERAVDEALGLHQDPMPYVADPTYINVTSANGSYYGRNISEDPDQPDAHSTLQVYLDNSNYNTAKGYVSTHGRMSGAWYGGGTAQKISLSNKMFVGLKNSYVSGSIGLGSGITINPDKKTLVSTAQTSTGTNTDVHNVNIQERVLTNLSLSGGWIDWVELRLEAKFKIANVSDEYLSNSIVQFAYSI